MLTKRPPFRGDTIAATLIKVVHDNPPSPRRPEPEGRPRASGHLSEVSAQDPARRYGSADALANDLGRWLRGEPTQAGGPTVGKHIRFWIRRNPIRVAAACLAVVVLWLAGVAGSLLELQAANREKAARLAREANDKLLMIQRAITLSAQDKDLIESLRRLKDRPDDSGVPSRPSSRRPRRTTTTGLLLTGCQPLFNLFVLDSKGKDLADTNKDNTEWLDKDFHRRDYFVGLSKLEREAVYVSRVYRSFPDRYYKIAVSRRILDGPECLAVLVVNVAVGSRLVDLDMRRECPAPSSSVPWIGTTGRGTSPRHDGATLMSWPWTTPTPMPPMPTLSRLGCPLSSSPDAAFRARPEPPRRS